MNDKAELLLRLEEECPGRLRGVYHEFLYVHIIVPEGRACVYLGMQLPPWAEPTHAQERWDMAREN